jgi:carbonic anhydrase
MLDELLESNRRFVDGFDREGLTSRPGRQLAVLTCMDCRIEPSELLDLDVGDAAVVRNAGGRATPDALRSLLLATRLLGVETVVVLHHTDCALAGIDDDSVRRQLAASGAPAVDGVDVLAMPDPDAALAADVEVLRTSSLLPEGTVVVGWRYDVATGRVMVVAGGPDDGDGTPI